jgi:hypothetical protein
MYALSMIDMGIHTSDAVIPAKRWEKKNSSSAR